MNTAGIRRHRTQETLEQHCLSSNNTQIQSHSAIILDVKPALSCDTQSEY